VSGLCQNGANCAVVRQQPELCILSVYLVLLESCIFIWFLSAAAAEMRNSGLRGNRIYRDPSAVVGQMILLTIGQHTQTGWPFLSAPDTKGSKNRARSRFGQAGAVSHHLDLQSGSDCAVPSGGAAGGSECSS